MATSTFNFETHPTATPFLAKMRERLEANEARNGLMLGLALRAETEPNYFGEDPYFATVENGIAVAAMMTPPHGVVLYCDPKDVGDAQEPMSEGLSCALWAIAHNLYVEGWPVPTVHGPSTAAARFAEIWSGLVSRSYHLASEQRAFELQEVLPPPATFGNLRMAVDADYELVMQWIREFDREAMGEEGNEERRHKIVSQKIEGEHFFIWEDGEPVSLAGITRPTTRGISIGPVYTPPDHRGHGYASAAVARLSQNMLDSGKKFCALFTDLANPTANGIYQKIGYRPVGDFRMYKFGEE